MSHHERLPLANFWRKLLAKIAKETGPGSRHMFTGPLTWLCSILRSCFSVPHPLPWCSCWKRFQGFEGGVPDEPLDEATFKGCVVPLDATTARWMIREARSALSAARLAASAAL